MYHRILFFFVTVGLHLNWHKDYLRLRAVDYVSYLGDGFGTRESRI